MEPTHPLYRIVQEAPRPTPRGNTLAVYNVLEPAVRDLVAQKHYTVKQAVNYLIAQGAWKGSEDERKALYRAMCYRLRKENLKSGNADTLKN